MPPLIFLFATSENGLQASLVARATQLGLILKRPNVMKSSIRTDRCLKQRAVGKAAQGGGGVERQLVVRCNADGRFALKQTNGNAVFYAVE